VVSIHDVSTVTRNRVEEMIRDLSREEVSVTSLLVIPDHHHRGQIDHDPEFAGWLRTLVAGGHEAVLHGFHHLRPQKENEGAVTRMITGSYTAGEGEFYDLSQVEAYEFLRRGREALAKCGTEPTGFIAPAWLLGREAETAVRKAGFEYTTRIGEVIDCKSGENFSSRSLVYSVRAPWRRGVSLLWNEGLLHGTGGNPLLRIGLHPPDWDYPSIRHHVLNCIRRAVQNRTVTTYGRWLDQWRARGH
jgi:predicted deacetylase